ncbi:MAG: linear amide C-N hydrolase, partial [Clostridia bacterium]|nr:linear amide C-N hydrolase [Clostridia bacterium]
EKKDSLNLAPFEIIPYVLGRCADVEEAQKSLEKLNVCDISFSGEFAATPLHWIVADKNRSIVVESVRGGLEIYENNIGIMTNEPPFPYHLARLQDFSGLCATDRGGTYSRGLSAYGLPGDFSSSSRFVRAAFLLENSVTEGSAVNQFFKILNSVSVPRGAVRLENGENVITQYESCMDMENGVYYYKTYSDPQIKKVLI